ncbi:hypothetical protein OHA37_06990 [Streptomyces sp. NBC_00335]|uniref:hypothetical protein n=1 Tax=unclassified Streptomyces TaxID=2593676 RepID=UPI0022547A6B|nr:MULTISPECIES: hypothetical protein [unclassified Streptomyces]MCX5403629.1 hypothetical protein [Streptomyces sp. NBC_00086]
MTRVRKAVAAAALTVPLLLATGCGIATSGVVESGRAGTVKLATAPDPGLLYFIAPDGALVPVPVSDRMQRSDAGFTIGELLEGPNEAAREAGLTSEIPVPDAKNPFGPDYARAGVKSFGDGKTLRVVLPVPVEPLSGPARRQLACTALAAVTTRPAPEILLIGSDGKEQNAVCEVRPED